jgi:hypothetical protein
MSSKQVVNLLFVLIIFGLSTYHIQATAQLAEMGTAIPSEILASTLMPTPLLPPPRFKVEVAEGVPQEDVQQALMGIALVQAYLKTDVGGDIGEVSIGTYTVRFVTTGRLEAVDRVASINVKNPSWKSGEDAEGSFPDAALVWHMQVAAHEYVHLWQHELGCLGRNSAPLGTWLTEGMAEFLAWQALIKAGYRTQEAVLLGEQNIAHTVARPTASLKSLQPKLQRYPSDTYAVSYLAVDQLIKHPVTGVRSLRHACESIAKGQSWEAVFQSAFGLSSKDFYLQFDTSRRKPAYSGGISGKITSGKGAPMARFGFLACPRAGNASCRPAITAADGTYTIALPNNTYWVHVDIDQKDVTEDDVYYYFNGGYGITPYFMLTTLITVKDSFVTGVNMQLTPPIIVSGIAGYLTDHNGNPMKRKLFWVCPEKAGPQCEYESIAVMSGAYTATDGRFFFRVPEGNYYLRVPCPGDPHDGFYSSEKGFTKDRSQASPIAVSTDKITTISIQCP